MPEVMRRQLELFRNKIMVDEEELYEDIKFEIHELEGDLSYGAMGREYRKYVLNNGFTSIKERLNEDLKHTAESLCVRVRMGWKPCPCSVLEQTEENEQPLYVACTFKEVEELMDENMKSGTAAARKLENIYKELSYLQYEFMDKHEKIGDNCYRTVYSDGSEVTVDYNNKTYSLKKG